MLLVFASPATAAVRYSMLAFHVVSSAPRTDDCQKAATLIVSFSVLDLRTLVKDPTSWSDNEDVIKESGRLLSQSRPGNTKASIRRGEKNCRLAAQR